MAKISQLPMANTPDGSETLPLVQDGQSRRVAIGPLIDTLAGPFADRAETALEVLLNLAVGSLYDTPEDGVDLVNGVPHGKTFVVSANNRTAKVYRNQAGTPEYRYEISTSAMFEPVSKAVSNTILSLNATFAELRGVPPTIANAISAVRTCGHVKRGLGNAVYTATDPFTGATFDAVFAEANPRTSFQAYDESGEARYFGLAEARPNSAMFGLVAGATDATTRDAVLALVASGDLPYSLSDLAIVDGATSPRTNRDILSDLETWVSARSKTAELEDQGQPILIDRPWRPRDGNAVTLSARVANILTAVVYAGSTSCVKLGENHPAYFDSTYASPVTFYTIGSPTAGTSQFTLDAGTNRAAGLAALSSGAKVFLCSTDRFVIGAGGWKRFDVLHLARILDINAATGVILIDTPLDEARGAFSICLADNPGIMLADGEFPMFALFDYTIEGTGALISVLDPLGRTATCNVHIRAGLLWGKTAFFGNAFHNTSMVFDIVSASEKLADVAGMSANSTFHGKTMVLRGAGADGTAALVINEQSRKIRVSWEHLIAANYSSSTLLRFLNCRSSGYIGESIFAPAATAAPIAEVCDTVSAPQTTSLSQGNYIDIAGNAGFGAVGRFFETSPNGDGFQIRRVRLHGSPSSNARLYGANGQIGAGVRAEARGLDIMSGAANWNILAGAHFAEGVVASTGRIADQNVSGAASTSWNNLRTALIDSATQTTIAATAAGTPFVTMTIPANALVARDVIDFEAELIASGNGGTKTIDVADATGVVASLAIPAGTQALVLRGKLRVQSNAALVLSGTIACGTQLVTFSVRRTGLNLSGLGFSLMLDAYKAVGGDALTVTSHSLLPRPRRNC